MLFRKSSTFLALLVSILSLSISQTYAQLKLPAIISDNMVLQYQKAPIWGGLKLTKKLQLKSKVKPRQQPLINQGAGK